ncbi:hypothetical protein F2P81_009251 [Scophthalmus maximus]|uniref:HAT C-terminal dimerisation domain-containing protein n=1 Tax=Scophthalmus maximus TaxID=52904 RepID=A0A6A4SYP8_SCOMX|nr:hypothetical protein F2P81_009251 [Scophthalmus maximus]
MRRRNCLTAPLVTDEAAAELEMMDLREEDQLKPALREGTTEFWKSVPVEKYPNVKRAALKILSMFGSTYCVFYPETREIKASNLTKKNYTAIRLSVELCACDWNPAVYGFTLSNYENNNIMVKEDKLGLRDDLEKPQQSSDFM